MQKITVSLIVFCLFALVGQSQVVELKSDFGTNGSFSKNLQNNAFATASSQRFTSVAVQPDGKLLAGGGIGTGVLIRYNADGTLDASFGTAGIAVVYRGGVQKVLLQPDGKILLGIGFVSYGFQMNVLRYNANGTVDATFGNRGMATVQVGDRSSGLSDMVLQPDGKIVVVGQADSLDVSAGFSRGDIGVIRLNSNGTLDPTFDGDGKKRFSIQIDDEQGAAVDLDFSDAAYPTGKIVIGGSTSGGGRRPFIARLLPNGSFDNSFDGDGRLIETFSFNSYTNDLKVLSDGRILTGGATYSNSNFSFDLTLIRYNADGSRDNSFDGDGLTVNPGGSTNTRSPAMAIHLLSNGGIVVGADRPGGGTSAVPVVSRFTTNGSLDPTFDGDGLRPFAYNSANFNTLYDLTVDNAGNYIAAGESQTPVSIYYYGLARFTPTGAADVTFDGDGFYSVSMSSSSDELVAVARQADGKLVAVGTSFTFSNVVGNGINRNFVLMRYGANGVLDASFGTGGVVLTDIGSATQDQATAVLIQADGKIVVAGLGGSGVALARYTTNGTLDATFDGDGKLSFAAVNSYTISNPFALVQESSGKLILGCTATYNYNDDIGLIRFNTDGSRDNTFASGLARFGSNGQDAGRAMLLLANGSIVVSGIANNAAGIVRFTPAGFSDNTFNSSGFATASFTTELNAISRDAAGNLLVIGPGNNTSNITLARYTAEGTLDNSFGTAGRVSTVLPGIDIPQLKFVQVQNDGRILLAGTVRPLNEEFNPIVLRYTATGSLDVTFNGNGYFTTDLRLASRDLVNGYVQNGPVLYGVGSIFTDSASDVLTLAINTGGSVPLPVTFRSFTAQAAGAQARLTWTIEQERNVVRYEVERSGDGLQFSQVGSLAARQTVGTDTYTWMDALPLRGKNWYRIRTVDADGTIKYTPTRLVHFGAVASLQIFPNPVKDQLQLLIPANYSAKLVRVVNAAGAVIQTQVLVPGSVQQLLLQQVPAGNYWLVTETEKLPFIKL